MESRWLSWLISNWYLLPLIVLDAFFGIFIIILMIFHFFLIANNLSTCIYMIILGELLSWEKITYMSKWPFEYGSPFSQGIIRNLKTFLCLAINKTGFITWEFPEMLPKNPIQKNVFIRCRSLWVKICD